MAAASCKQSEFPAFLALVVGGGEERIENEGGAGSGAASQQCWLSLASPVPLLGVSPIEIASDVLRGTRAGIVTGGYMACRSQSWNLRKCQHANDSAMVHPYHRLLQGSWKE